MAVGATGAAQARMQRHHGALAEADQRQRVGRQLPARQFGVEKFVERGRGLVDADPALVGIAEGEPEPLPADRRLPAGLGRMRRDEGGVRQDRLPGAADIDQVVAVGAIAVQENHEALGLAGCRLKAWSAQSGHSVSLSVLRPALRPSISSCADSFFGVVWMTAPSRRFTT